MACEEVGSASLEISGLQILLALAIQAFLSIVLSVWSSILLYKLLRKHGVNRYVEMPDVLADDQSRRDVKKLGYINEMLLKIGEVQNYNGEKRHVVHSQK